MRRSSLGAASAIPLRKQPGERLGEQRRAEQQLGDRVVEVARQPLTLFEDREAAFLGEEAGVLDRHRQGVGDELEQLHVDGSERPVAFDVDHPERPAGMQDRHRELGLHRDPRGRLHVARVGGDIVDDLRPALAHRRAHDTARDRDAVLVADAFLVGATADAHHQRLGIALVEQRQIDVGVPEQFVDGVGGLLQHVEELQVGGDDPPYPHQQQELLSGAGVGRRVGRGIHGRSTRDGTANRLHRSIFPSRRPRHSSLSSGAGADNGR